MSGFFCAPWREKLILCKKKAPRRLGSPNHYQAYFIIDFHFKPFPDTQDLSYLIPLCRFPDIPSLPIFLLKLKPGLPSTR